MLYPMLSLHSYCTIPSILFNRSNAPFQFTQQLFTSRKPANPFVPVSQEQVLSDLAESHRQIAAGDGIDMEDALNLH